MKFDTGSGVLCYEVVGHGPDLLLSHGVIEAAASWDDVVAFLCEHFRVISYDARGRGRSGGGGVPFGFAELAADVEALADHLGLASFFHAGHSMGGRVVLEHAFAFPARVAGIAVVSARAEAPGPAGRARLQGLVDRVGVEGPGVGVDLWTSPADSYYERAFAISAASPVDGTAQALSALVNMDSFVPHLAAVGVPALVVAGDRDGEYLKSAQLMAERMPHASLQVLADVGHFPNFQCPELLATLLAQHFGSGDRLAPT
jgi:pimeloyl-ACP methyl ester carboxylesterase